MCDEILFLPPCIYLPLASDIFTSPCGRMLTGVLSRQGAQTQHHGGVGVVWGW